MPIAFSVDSLTPIDGRLPISISPQGTTPLSPADKAIAVEPHRIRLGACLFGFIYQDPTVIASAVILHIAHILSILSFDSPWTPTWI